MAEQTSGRKAKSSKSAKTKAHNPPPHLVKQLNLRPSDKQAFVDFAAEKKPTSFPEKCTVATYYLSDILEVSAIEFHHVFTCFKEAGWRTPKNLYQTLLGTAHRQGWLDTSNTSNITVTPPGKNLVEYDLPREAGNAD